MILRENNTGDRINMIRDEITENLFKMQDIKYRDFQSKLIPSKTADDMIGVRTPELRKYAKDLLKREDIDELKYPDMVSAIRSDEYYINMMTAWYFATALAKQYDAILPYIEEKKLDKWTHNKAIQKSVESFRITPEQKAYLKTLKY